MRKVIAVRNNSRVGVIRANLLFPAGRVVTIMLDTDTSKFKEVKACSSLDIVGIEDYVEVETPTHVVKIDTEESAVVEPEVAVKVDDAPEEPAPAPEPEPVVEEPAPAPEPEPIVDVTPIVVAPEPPAENVAELEVVEPVAAEVVAEPVPFTCPYCGEFSAAKKTSALNHVRSKHPENYDAYKELLSNA